VVWHIETEIMIFVIIVNQKNNFLYLQI